MKFIWLCACVQMSVGLGNVWRFPSTAYDHGGGAFILAYLIVNIVLTRSIYFLEMAFGQYSGRNHYTIWEMAPICKGRLAWFFLTASLFRGHLHCLSVLFVLLILPLLNYLILIGSVILFIAQIGFSSYSICNIFSSFHIGISF